MESTGNGYSVTEYHQTSSQNADAEAIFPDHILELYDERFAIIRNWSHYENAYDAQLLLFRAQGLETDIDALLIDAWNFMALQERRDEELADEWDDEGI